VIGYRVELSSIKASIIEDCLQVVRVTTDLRGSGPRRVRRRNMASNPPLAGAVIALCATTQASAQGTGDVERAALMSSERASTVTRSGAANPSRRTPMQPFEAIARFQGLAAPSLFELLRTSHETMPNIFIDTNDLRDVAAYILA
jgi:hypothetical protein